MKVVLFCGGLGMHMREASPKPMVPVGYRPILWHVLNPVLRPLLRTRISFCA